MEYAEHTYRDLAVAASVSSFKPAGGVGEWHVMLSCLDAALPFKTQIACLVQAFALAVSDLPAAARPVFKRYFLSDAANQAADLPADEPCAVSVIEQPPLAGTKAAMWACLVEDIDVSRLECGLWKAAHGAFAHLWQGNMHAPDLNSELATVALLKDYSLSLAQAGCALEDNCVRTWFFVHDVDNNYRGVVIGRNAVFDEHGLLPSTHFIASTGIGGSNANRRALVTLDAYAVAGLEKSQIRYLRAPANLNPTHEYGVAFERGTAIEYGDRRHVFISGTASINNKGEVMHPGDIVKQTARMLANVKALLDDAGCGWGDVAQCIVYLRDPADYLVASRLLADALGPLPRVITLAPVCRSGWLIEMECSAIVPNHNPALPPL